MRKAIPRLSKVTQFLSLSSSLEDNHSKAVSLTIDIIRKCQNVKQLCTVKSRHCWYIDVNVLDYFLLVMLFFWCKKSIQPRLSDGTTSVVLMKKVSSEQNYTKNRQQFSFVKELRIPIVRTTIQPLKPTWNSSFFVIYFQNPYYVTTYTLQKIDCPLLIATCFLFLIFERIVSNVES